MLRQLCANPGRSFWRHELEAAVPGGLELAVGSGLVHDVGIAQDGDVYVAPDGTAYTVAVHDGHCLGVPCDDSDYYEIINLPADELVRYRLNLGRVAAEMQSESGIQGEVQEVGPRALYLGEWRDDHGEVPVLLVMPPSKDACATMLMGLPLQLPGRHRRIVVALPANMPGETEVRRLNDAGIWPLELASCDAFRVDVPRALDQGRGEPTLRVYTNRHQVWFRGVWVDLAPLEVAMMASLAANAGDAVTYESIARDARGYVTEDIAAQVRKQVSSTKAKLRDVRRAEHQFTDADVEQFIRNVPSVGYLLALSPEDVEILD